MDAGVTEDGRYIAYRVRILPHQLAAARARLRQLEAEARRYGFFDLLDAAPASSAASPISGPAPLGQSGAVRGAPTHGADGGES